jgi:hypothetical protein
MASNEHVEAWSDVRMFTTGPWNLDFTESFDTLFTDNIQGQRGWVVDPNYRADVLLGAGSAQAGPQYARLTNGTARGSAQLRHSFDNTDGTDVVWTDFFGKPVFVTRTNNVSIGANATTVFFVESGAGHVVVMDGTNQTVLSGKPIVTAGEWTRFTVKADYDAKTWDLWMDTAATLDPVEMATDLGFYNASATKFKRFGVEEGSASSATYVDSINITTTKPEYLPDGAMVTIW